MIYKYNNMLCSNIVYQDSNIAVIWIDYSNIKHSNIAVIGLDNSVLK